MIFRVIIFLLLFAYPLTAQPLMTVPVKQDHFAVFHPEDDLFTLKDRITIKGLNRFRTPVYLNDHLIEVSEDGRFLTEYVFEKPGKHPLLFTFFKPDGSVHQLQKNVLKLSKPLGLDQVSKYKLESLYLAYSPFLNPDSISKALNQPITRADLAHFLYTLQENPVTASMQIIDVPEDFWAKEAITWVVREEYMRLFPDKRFQPQKTVTTLEYMMSLVIALNLSFEDVSTVLPYSDIDKSHWTTKYVATLRYHDLIQDKGFLNLDGILTYYDFIKLIMHVPKVSQFITQLGDYSQGFDFSEERSLRINETLAEAKNSFLQKLKDNQKLSFDSPEPFALVTTNNIAFKGTVFPPQAFRINQLTITPDDYGYFSLSLPLKRGRNSFLVEVFDRAVTQSVFALTAYEDLQGHWIKESALKLRFLKLLPPDTNFNPNEDITRASFSAILKTMFDLPGGDKVLPQMVDVNITNPNYNAILNLISLGILSVDRKSYFHPEKPLTKAAAITAIMRLLTLFPNNSLMLPEEMPYLDVPESHWAKNDIIRALALGLISPGELFNPNKTISKAELVSILSKTEPIEKQLKEYFLTHDEI